MAGKRVGILALQGAFLEHESAFKRCGAQTSLVRRAEQIKTLDALVIPGGESTAMGTLMTRFGLDQAIISKARAGMPVWGTCAGMILLAREVVASKQPTLGLMDIAVRRNAFGRQVDSFEAELVIEGIGITRGVFIRAPYVERVWGETKILCEYQEKIVMVEENNLLATSFHPELTETLDIQKYFLQKA